MRFCLFSDKIKRIYVYFKFCNGSKTVPILPKMILNVIFSHNNIIPAVKNVKNYFLPFFQSDNQNMTIFDHYKPEWFIKISNMKNSTWIQRNTCFYTSLSVFMHFRNILASKMQKYQNLRFFDQHCSCWLTPLYTL